jgi:hypothetical protein
MTSAKRSAKTTTGLKSVFMALALAGLVGGVAVTPAEATPVGESSAYGVSVDLNVASAIHAGLGPIGQSAGNAPGAYETSDTVLGIDEVLGLGTGLLGGLLGNYGEGLSTGVITTHAGSGLPDVLEAHASASVDDLSSGLVLQLPILGGLSLLSIGASTIASSASVADAGGLLAAGDTTIEDLTLGGSILDGLLPISLALYAAPDPNTVLLDLLGVKITLNEQMQGAFGDNGLALTTNAMHIAFDDYLLGGSLLNGDIIIGSSYAALDLGAPDTPVGQVPEPATLGLMGVGLIGAGVFYRRRRPA